MTPEDSPTNALVPPEQSVDVHGSDATATIAPLSGSELVAISEHFHRAMLVLVMCIAGFVAARVFDQRQHAECHVAGVARRHRQRPSDER